ncbi:sugar phosphate isomerase/epimerase [Amycolatopsis sp. PS_44_ISF1]|uniref:sugar phosphate isomerase/epimerase family protein n=1 Tax=Amycolatopsis sp. PS_44_ISF1 TaxID=2974917 RepID=UPI0028E0807F|nr:sugar phosphate isomerase/epimerase [Amycolatopsis sp. PS_44_ISF1]MDT8915964.1 sugar phosphate isomerase/epimerase [Amycolatopsis sp. PS_44_ISF1]
MCGEEAEKFHSRRSVLRGAATAAVAAAGAAVALPGIASAAGGAEPDGLNHRRGRVPVEKISIQLYSLRTALEADLPGTLSALADIGYRKVELAGTYGRTAEEFRGLLDRNHLRASSTHVGIDGDLDRTIADARVLGNTRANVPFAAFDTIAGWKEFAGRMDAAARAFRRSGIALGYHNHAHEFAPIEGVLPYDVLRANTNPWLVHLEIDLFWAVEGGADPITLYRKNFPRTTQYHVKDRTADGRMVDPGQGVIDFPRIFRATTANLAEYIVEHDNPADALTTAQNGFSYLHHVRF